MRLVVLMLVGGVAATPPGLPAGAVEYAPAATTQSVFRLNDVPTTSRVPIRLLPDTRWHQSGGMHGIRGVESKKYRTLPEGRGVIHTVSGIAVKNSFGNYQTELGVTRSYPDGTRFDDVLSHKGKVFEHRVREKQDGRWKSRVAYSDPAARPPLYFGLTRSCASCHDEAGTGGYAVGLVPGGDTVLSDPLDWSVWRGGKWKW